MLNQLKWNQMKGYEGAQDIKIIFNYIKILDYYTIILFKG